MGPPARVGTKTHQPTAEIQPMTGTRPIIEEVSEPAQRSPKKLVGTTVPQNQSLAPNSPAEAPSSSKPKQIFPNVQKWIPILSEGHGQTRKLSNSLSLNTVK